jgi:hypothetical protein
VREAERGEINRRAVAVGAQVLPPGQNCFRLHVVANTVAGRGGMVGLFKDEITAVLQLGAMDYHKIGMHKKSRTSIFETQ